MTRRKLISTLRIHAGKRKLSQGKIARLTGYSRPSITLLLSGSSNVGLDKFCKVAEAVGLSITLTPKP